MLGEYWGKDWGGRGERHEPEKTDGRERLRRMEACNREIFLNFAVDRLYFLRSKGINK